MRDTVSRTKNCKKKGGRGSKSVVLHDMLRGAKHKNASEKGGVERNNEQRGIDVVWASSPVGMEAFCGKEDVPPFARHQRMRHILPGPTRAKKREWLFMGRVFKNRLFAVPLGYR
jgi:hypothetical protein